MNKEKRCDEFQSCLGSGKNIYQLEQEGMFIDEELQAREQTKSQEDYWGKGW